MNKELALTAKKYNFEQRLSIGYYVDAIDQNRWKVARVVATKSFGHRLTYTLHFDGYPSAWDEDFDVPGSTKMAPFRRFTLPYTGPTAIGKEIHRPPVTYNFTDAHAMLKKINKEDKQKLKAEWIMQNFRGQLFILIDTILTQSIKLKQQQLDEAVKLIETYIETGVSIMNFALEKIAEISKQNVVDPNAVYVNPIYALVSSLPEILFTFNSLISYKERRVRFYFYNDDSIETLKKKMKKLILGKDIATLCKKILQYQNPPYRGFSWAIKKQVLILLSGMEQPIEFPKILDPRQMTEALDYLGYLSQKQAFSELDLESIHVELVLSHIVSGNFEGKLKGLAELKKLCEGPRVKKQLLKQKILTPSLLEALTDNSTFNGEIFKRSFPLFEAAAKFDLLNDDILNRILALHKDKHELEQKSYYSTLADFGSILSEKKTLAFFEQIKKFDLDANTINLVKQFTLKVINDHPYYRRRNMQAETGFGITYLWKIVKQQNSQEMTNTAIEAIAVLLKDYYYREFAEKLFMECFSNIKQGKNVESSLRIVHSCLNKNPKLVSLVDTIDKQFNIIDTVIKSLTESAAISPKTIQSTFEFLEEVNQFAKRKITVDHIKQLWRLKQCRGSLLKFMRKCQPNQREERATDKILMKKLEVREIQEIITKIFTNQGLMENYANIDEEAFKTMDELIVSLNHKLKNILYNEKHTIRSISYQQYVGVDLYLDIGINVSDEQMAKRAIKRFVQFYIRPHYLRNSSSQGVQKDKIALWMVCSERLSKLMDASPRKYLAYSILFDEIKGRMYSINILDPSPSTVAVWVKTSNRKKEITVPRCYSLWHFRQVVNQEFKLENTNFEMFLVDKQCITDMIWEEDYSVAFIESKKTQWLVIVTESKEIHPHLVAVEDFQANFSSLYAEKIYETLTNITAPSIQANALKILLQVPIPKSLETKFLKLQINKSVAWQDILDNQSKARLRYQLHIVKKVKSAGLQWITSFIKKGGLEQITRILISRSQSKVLLSAQDYGVLCLMMEFFNENVKFFKITGQPFPLKENDVVEIIRICSKDKANDKLFEEPSVLNYFYLSVNVLVEILKYEILDGSKILASQRIFEILELLLFTGIKISNNDLQERLPQIIVSLYSRCKLIGALSSFLGSFLDKFVSNQKMRYTCRNYFNLLVFMFEKNQVTNELHEAVFQFIKDVRFGEPGLFVEKESSANQMIYGWLRITKCLIMKKATDKGQLRAIPEPNKSFADFVISEGLLREGYRFESEKSRTEAFEILRHLDCDQYICGKITEEIKPILVKASWRKQNQWFIKSFKKREENTKVGLKNLAATCYINSLMQQLYHIQQFRDALLNVDTQQIQATQNVAYELQRIFAHLRHSNREVYSTERFCENFRVEGQPIDPRVQMDVDEFYHTLMDKLEQNLMKIGKANIIDDVFKGEYSNLIVGVECQHKSQRVEHFISMRLQIINKSSLEQALAEFIKVQILEGENAYFCQKCDKKIKAAKRVCVKSLPDVLILTLKRFQFDYDRMQKFKLNSFCQFGQDLDMLPYMRETLYDIYDKSAPENYIYKLKGVIIHYGVSQAGHYTSYVKTQNGEWKYFDDDKISGFEYKNLGKQCFGGNDDNPYSDNAEKIKNAYVLIYEKVHKENKVDLAISQRIKGEIQTQNRRNQQIKMLFNPGLQHYFDSNCVSLGKTYLLYTHIVTLRSEIRAACLKNSYEKCIQIFESNPEIAQWYLNEFSQKLLKQFLIYSWLEIPFFVASLIIFCLKKVFNPDFLKRCMKCLDRKNMAAMSKIYQAASIISSYAKVLQEYSFQQRVYKMIKEEKPPSQGSLAKLDPTRSEFGQPTGEFLDKKDYRGILEAICSIENFRVNKFELDLIEMESFMRKAKKLSTQASVCTFYANRVRDQESFKKIITLFAEQYLLKFHPKPDEQCYFRFTLILLSKFAQIKDQLTKKRIEMIASIYANALQQFMEGYKSMRMLLEGLFSLAFNNELFREEIVMVLNHKDLKKLVKALRDWMKQSLKFGANIRADKLYYWKKTSRMTFQHLDKVEADKKVTPETYLQLLNALLERHRIDFPNLYSPEVKVGEQISLNEFEEYEYTVVSKLGLLLQVRKLDGTTKFIFQDDAYPRRCI